MEARQPIINIKNMNFVWNGQNLAAENKADSVNTYTYDMTGVHIANQNGVVTSYLKDYHGNVVAKANALGNMIDEIYSRRDYDAFGNQWQGTQSDPFGYCGEYYDSESGLVYLRNRYYDSATGRFITEDPIKDGLNWYVYCSNNPVMFVDPSGLIHYIYTGIDQINHSNKYAKELKDKTSIDAKVIVVDSADSFYQNWSSMGSDSDIDNVIINVHGDTGNIYASNGEIIDIGSLEKKEFDTLLLLSCEGGNLDTKNSNPAAQFVKNQNIKQVIAADGEVILVTIDGNYGRRIEGFGAHYKGQSRKGEGFIAYQYMNNEIMATNNALFKYNIGNLKPILNVNTVIDTGANIGKATRCIMYTVGLLKEVNDVEKSIVNVLNSICR